MKVRARKPSHLHSGSCHLQCRCPALAVPSPAVRLLHPTLLSTAVSYYCTFSRNSSKSTVLGNILKIITFPRHALVIVLFLETIIKELYLITYSKLSPLLDMQ